MKVSGTPWDCTLPTGSHACLSGFEDCRALCWQAAPTHPLLLYHLHHLFRDVVSSGYVPSALRTSDHACLMFRPCSQVACLAIPLYSILPAVGEFMIEQVKRISDADPGPPKRFWTSGFCALDEHVDVRVPILSMRRQQRVDPHTHDAA